MAENIALDALQDGTVVWDGFDDALVGFGKVVRGNELHEVAMYSYEKMVQVLLKSWEGTQHDGDEVAVEEYLQYNVLGGYLGPNTPVVLIESWLDVAPDDSE